MTALAPTPMRRDLETLEFVVQTDIDARHEAERFSGCDWDHITGDYSVWRLGRWLGYARTSAEGWKLIRGEI